MVYVVDRYLTLQEMTVNAQYIFNYLSVRGWAKESISGMLGNMQSESTINPGLWERGGGSGYGLVQWTPSTIYTNWANQNGLEPNNMDSQLMRILYELDNGLQWITKAEYPISFRQFTQSRESPEYLASAFLKNYERAGVEKENERREQARYWFNVLVGEGGTVSFIYPTVTRVTSGFRTPDRPDHHGVDFAESGTHEIKASAGGIVTQSRYSDSYGEVVYILHNINGQEWETVYAHMRSGSRTVQVGDTVSQGQVIGIMGNTGASDGQHLHFELHKGRWNDAKSNAVDPLLYLGFPSGGGDGDGGSPDKKKTDLIKLLLCDALNGWKY